MKIAAAIAAGSPRERESERGREGERERGRERGREGERERGNEGERTRNQLACAARVVARSSRTVRDFAAHPKCVGLGFGVHGGRFRV